MADLSKYTAGILTEDDRSLFQEAEASGLLGAPRGAYILVWIACAEGLKRKFREAAVRDGEANRIFGQITQAENQQSSADMLILTKAKDYGFIDDVAFQKLEYVYKMRCIYGHPYEAAPDDEELTNAAAVVVNEVLGKPTPTGCATSWKPRERRNLRMSILSFVRFLNDCLSENVSVAFPSALCLFCLR
jgi:hypothetical protein